MYTPASSGNVLEAPHFSAAEIRARAASFEAVSSLDSSWTETHAICIRDRLVDIAVAFLALRAIPNINNESAVQQVHFPAVSATRPRRESRSQHPALAEPDVAAGAVVGGVLPRIYYQRNPEAREAEDAAHSDHDVGAEAHLLLGVRHDVVVAVRTAHVHRSGAQGLLRNHHHGRRRGWVVRHDLKGVRG